MGKAEVGSTKYLANKMKAKGLQRLRWYCQACERQMRDENGFKQHSMSEAHIRNMQLIGEDPRKYIRQYSNDFKRDFLQLLRTAHGEKPVQVNRFYQEYIANKEHVHMNATQWNSLSEFAKQLGREGICRVTEDDKGLYIAWIDNSPDALRRQEKLRKKEQQDRGDEEREKREIQAQVERAHAQQTENTKAEEQDADRILERKEGELITLDFGLKKKTEIAQDETPSTNGQPDQSVSTAAKLSEDSGSDEKTTTPESMPLPASSGVKLSFGSKAPKPKNVFAAAKKSSSGKSAFVKEPEKKISEAERIMREELDRKRKAQDQNGAPKKMRFAI